MDDEDQPPVQLGAMPNSPDRDRLEYDLTIRQQPKQARMCGVGGKADRRPIDPPPIIQLQVYEKGSSRSSSPDGSHSQFLQNPYYFMFASLASPDTDEELHLLKDGKTRCTTGSVVSSLYHLKDTELEGERGPARDAGFFVFPDLSVRTEGSYRLKLTLFEVVDTSVHYCKHIFTAPFYVYTAKKFPGMEESTNLSCALADQGIKIRIRKDIRIRKNRVPIQPLPDDQQNIPPTARALGLPPPMEDSEDSGDEHYPDKRNGNGRSERENKRQRLEGPESSSDPVPGPPPPSQANGSWSIDPNLSPITQNAPPAMNGQDHPGYDPRVYGSVPPPPHMQHQHHVPSHQDYHHPPPAHHQHPGHVPPPNHHHGPPPPPQAPPPHPGYGSYWGPQVPPQPYAGYPPYDHHQAHIPPPGPPSSHSQHQRGPAPPGPPPPQHYVPQPIHYGAPPPYPYYDRPYGQTPLPPPPPPGVPVSPPSPRVVHLHHSQSSGRNGSKDGYGSGSQAQPLSVQPGPSGAPPMSTYPQQDYNYGRPPPPPAPQDSSSIPQQQSRGYQQPYAPGPPPQHQQPQHMAHYPPHVSGHHPGYPYPPDSYGWSYQPFQPQGQQPMPPPPSQGPPGQLMSPYSARPTTQWPGMPSTPPSVHPPPGQGQYGYRTPPGAHQSFGDAYGQPSIPPDHRGYARPPQEDGRRTPPPSMPMQSRHPSYNNGNVPPLTGGGQSPSQGYASNPLDRRPSGNSPSSILQPSVNTNMGDRIQLAPLRASASSPSPTSATSPYSPFQMNRAGSGPNGSASGPYGPPMHLERTASSGSVAGKKNLLSIGSIISDEKN